MAVTKIARKRVRGRSLSDGATIVRAAGGGRGVCKVTEETMRGVSN
jgi:hypothetical protein